MAIISVLGSVENTVGLSPNTILIDTSDSLATTMGLGYLNGVTSIVLANNQMALVNTTSGLIWLQVSIVGANKSLIYPINQSIVSLKTSPPGSQSASLSVGTAFQNTLGYDIMLSVYLNITAALTASILLGVSSSNTPTQQTIVSGLSLAALNIIPVNIYIPSNYYAKLSTSGTITMSISGQIAMPI